MLVRFIKTILFSLYKVGLLIKKNSTLLFTFSLFLFFLRQVDKIINGVGNKVVVNGIEYREVVVYPNDLVAYGDPFLHLIMAGGFVVFGLILLIVVVIWAGIGVIKVVKARESTEKEGQGVKNADSPGYHFLTFIKTFVSCKKVEMVFEPVIADWCEEHFEALASGSSRAKLFTINLKYSWALVKVSSLEIVFRTKSAISLFTSR